MAISPELIFWILWYSDSQLRRRQYLLELTDYFQIDLHWYRKKVKKPHSKCMRLNEKDFMTTKGGGNIIALV